MHAPGDLSLASDAVKLSAYTTSPKNSRLCASGTARVTTRGARGEGAGEGVSRVDGAGSAECSPSVGHRQGKDRNRVRRPAGREHPRSRQRAERGLSPTMLFGAAGTRPDPAVSVPSANETYPAPPPPPNPRRTRPAQSPNRRHSSASHRASAPTNPVANWSRFVLPKAIAPAAAGALQRRRRVRADRRRRDRRPLLGGRPCRCYPRSRRARPRADAARGGSARASARISTSERNVTKSVIPRCRKAAKGLGHNGLGRQPCGIGGVMCCDVEGQPLGLGAGHDALPSGSRNSIGTAHWISTTHPSSDQTRCDVPAGFRTREPSP